MQRWQPTWQATTRGNLLLVAGVLLLAVGVWWGVLRDGGPPAPSSAPSAPSDVSGGDGADGGDEPLEVTGALDLVPGCRRDTCRVASSRDGFRYRGRRALLAVVTHRDAGCGGLPPARLHLVDADGVAWSGPPDAVCGDPLEGIETDRAGNAFVRFPAGAHDSADRLVVLRVRGDDVEDFGSFGGRFAGDGVSAGDLDGDGIHEVVLPGEEGSTVHRWTGSGWQEGS